jgi:hypothetical protein
MSRALMKCSRGPHPTLMRTTTPATARSRTTRYFGLLFLCFRSAWRSVVSLLLEKKTEARMDFPSYRPTVPVDNFVVKFRSRCDAECLWKPQSKVGLAERGST